MNYYYYNSNLSKIEKKEVIKKFIISINNLFYNYIISTNKLEEGFNYSNIHLVIYFELGYNFINFIQGLR